ncbi:MAG: hypothetical protein ACLP19_25590 [Xanthobacteraceae bacterium]
MVTQVVPLPSDVNIPLVARYQKALKAINPNAEPGFVSLEGYIDGRLVVEALRHLENPVTRAGFLSTIKNVGGFDLDGLKLSFRPPHDNQGMDKVFLTVIQADGSFKAVDRLEPSADMGPCPQSAGGDVPEPRPKLTR